MGYAENQSDVFEYADVFEYILQKVKDGRLFKSVTHNLSWDKYVEQWSSAQVLWARYEDMINNCFMEMKRILSTLQIKRKRDEINQAIYLQRFDIKKNTFRKGEKKRRHMRKGIVGDHKNIFDEMQIEKMNFIFSKTLSLLGYEN